MKILTVVVLVASSAIVSASAFADGVGNNGSGDLNPLVACSSLDHSKPIPVGTQCKTSKGEIFENVSRDKFGEAWKGQDGLIWSDQLGRGDQYKATEMCKNLGGELPSREDFERGEANGFREVLPNLNGQWTWSSRYYSDVGYVYYGEFGGYFGQSSRKGSESVRCVGQEFSRRQNDPKVTNNDRKVLSDSQIRQASETSEAMTSAGAAQ